MKPLRLALQKQGRLSDESFSILTKCGIDLPSKKELIYRCQKFPLEILLVRDDDIPCLIYQNICDIGIVGNNVIEETFISRSINHLTNAYEMLKILPFGECRLSLACPKELNYKVEDIQNRSIATSYPHLLERFLAQHKIQATVVQLSGSVEIAPRIGVADLICDLVSTGATLAANGLKEIEAIFTSEARLIKRSKPFDANQEAVMHSLLSRIEGVLKAKESKYIMLHAPKNRLQEIVTLLPGAEHPTIMQLENDDQHIAIHAVCYERVFWENMEQLKAKGASAILVMPIEKMLL